MKSGEGGGGEEGSPSPLPLFRPLYRTSKKTTATLKVRKIRLRYIKYYYEKVSGDDQLLGFRAMGGGGDGDRGPITTS